MEYIIGLVIWMFIGNLWVEQLNSVTKQLYGVDIELSEWIIGSLIWPYSIYVFMNEIKHGLKNQNKGDIPATMKGFEQMVNDIDEYVAKRIGVDVDTYTNVMDTKCTDEEINDIVTTTLSDNDEDGEEMKRVRELFNSKLNN